VTTEARSSGTSAPALAASKPRTASQHTWGFTG